MDFSPIQMLSRATQPLRARLDDQQRVLSPEARAQQWALVAQWAIGLVAAIVVAPYLLLVLKSVFGLLAAAATGTLLINRSRVWSEKLAHWRLRSLREEMQAHYLDALEEALMRRRQAWDEACSAVADLKATLAQQHACMRSPAALDASDSQPPALALEAQLDEALARAEQDLALLEKQVENARASWQMAQAQRAVAKALGRTRGHEFDTFKTNTALQAAEAAAYRSSAHLAMALQRCR